MLHQRTNVRAFSIFELNLLRNPGTIFVILTLALNPHRLVCLFCSLPPEVQKQRSSIWWLKCSREIEIYNVFLQRIVVEFFWHVFISLDFELKQTFLLLIALKDVWEKQRFQIHTSFGQDYLSWIKVLEVKGKFRHWQLLILQEKVAPELFGLITWDSFIN